MELLPGPQARVGDLHVPVRLGRAAQAEAALRQAIERLDRAVAADPNFALAWAARAEALVLLYVYTSTPDTEALPEARRSAHRALELDSGLAEAHAALGLTAHTEFAWEEAEREFRKAIELSPGYAMAYHWYASLLKNRGRFDESMKVRERALELDPLSIPIHMGYGLMLSAAGRDEEAEAMYRKAMALDPGHFGILMNLGALDERQGRFEEALAKRQMIASLDPGGSLSEIVAGMRTGWRSEGAEGYWRAKAEGILRFSRPGFAFHRFEAAEALAQLGRIDEAFEILEGLVAARDPSIYQINGEQLLEPLRSDPRYRALLERAGLIR
ncbi:MAG: tetratricopeptide repeat protein [Gemmatimonadetes bacterium]|nr:tetratricopeptide repeat protein [Gemmatimonadota bacterium]